MGIILSITAYFLVAVFAPIGILYQVFFKFKTLKRYFFFIAISLDQLGNTICAGLLDLTLITKDSHSMFGSPDETVSSVLGKNKAFDTLTLLGKFICKILNTIQKDHVEKGIEKDEGNR
jgi:hypothetical protein